MKNPSAPLRAALVLLVLAAGIYAAQAFGLGEGNRFGREGAIGKRHSGGGVSCSNKLDFSQSCNSQYLL